MDFESNCGDANDELQMFENTPKTRSTVVTSASVGCGTSDRTKSVGASGKRISSDVGKEIVAKKVQDNTYEVWNHYEKIDLIDVLEKCKCKGYGRFYTCNSDNRTCDAPNLGGHFFFLFNNDPRTVSLNSDPNSAL